MPDTQQTTLNAALPNPRQDVQDLDKLERKLFALNYALGEILTFGPVIDPPKATPERAEAMAVLDGERQALLAAPATGALLDRLQQNEAILDVTHRAQLKILKRDRASLVNVPPELQEEFTRLTTESDDVWRRAKAADDWASFEPYLDRIVDLMVRMAQAKDPSKDPYDVWLDEYEHGTDRAFYDGFFSQVKECVVPLLADCMASRHKPSAKPVQGNFDEARQWQLARDIMDLEGVDTDALWIGKTEHPFTGGPGIGFTVIASHVYPSNLLSNVFSMLHEGGHVLYEQNVDPAYRFTSLKGGTSSGMHEAQSRFFENYVGRSRAFADPMCRLLAKHFPGQLGRMTAYQLFMAENCAEPCLIRCDADELTYPLHIIVRYEIEQLLFSGEAKAADVPGLWAEKYRQYLGLGVPNYTDGALQDTHWADGSFGYFPTYALGNAFGAQFRDAMIAQGVDFEGACASGDLAPIRTWLRDNIWHWGRAKDSDELIQAACGEPFDPSHYTRYLVEKFSSIYGL